MNESRKVSRSSVSDTVPVSCRSPKPDLCINQTHGTKNISVAYIDRRSKHLVLFYPITVIQGFAVPHNTLSPVRSWEEKLGCTGERRKVKVDSELASSCSLGVLCFHSPATRTVLYSIHTFKTFPGCTCLNPPKYTTSVYQPPKAYPFPSS